MTDAGNTLKAAALLSPAVLSCLVLGAHFLRFGLYPITLLCALLPLVLLARRVAAVRAVQLFLVLGGALWGITARTLVRARLEDGKPWLRLALILGFVALFALGGALALETRELKARLRGGWRG
jgi:hypothetical protein